MIKLSINKRSNRPNWLEGQSFTQRKQKSWKDLNHPIDRQLEREEQARIVGISFDDKNI